MAWLYQRNDSRHWWIGWRVGRKSFFRSTGTQDRAEAERQLAQVRAMFESHKAKSLSLDVYESLTGRSLPKKSLDDALQDWLDECQSTTSHETAERYRTVADAFRESLGANENWPLLSDITAEHIRTFLVGRRKNRDASTVNLERKILSVFFKRAKDNHLLKASPSDAVKPFKPGRGEKQERRDFTLAELRDIYRKADALGDFWRYLTLAGTYSGQRMGDLICLVWGAVDFNENVIKLAQRKTGKTVKVPVHPALRALLLKLRVKAGRAAKPEDFIWPDEASDYHERGAGKFSNTFYDRILVPCGIMPPRSHKGVRQGRDAKRNASPVSFHSLRHSFVTLLQVAGGSKAVARELAGHSSDTVNDIYTHLPVEMLADAINKLPEVTK